MTRAVPDLNHVRSAHLIGISGAGMTPLGTILLQQGTRVTGSDLVDAASLKPLRELGATIWIGHDGSRLGSPEVVVTTAAATPDNPEIAAAQAAGIPIVKHAAALASLMHARRGIAVAGTHGKSTTSGMIAHILQCAGLDPTFHVGAELINYGLFGRLGQGEFLVAEADEFDRRFLAYDPEIAVVTFAEPDHLDYFGTYEAMLEAYAQFLQRVRDRGVTVVNSDDPGASNLLCRGRRVTYGRGSAADWRLVRWTPKNRAAGEILVKTPTGQDVPVELGVLGAHNAENATAALAASVEAGVPVERAAAALATFRGVRRRLERVGSPGEVTVVDDYAHHPTEVRASLAAATAHWKADGARGAVWAIYQPHTEHRTASLFDEFLHCFDDADHLVLVPAYMPTGRVLASGGATAAQLAEAMDHPDVRALETQDAIAAVASEATPGDVVLVMGAGDVWTIESPLLAALEERFGAESEQNPQDRAS
jgi:UDP-N-acetylmuramate--alanine ligase